MTLKRHKQFFHCAWTLFLFEFNLRQLLVNNYVFKANFMTSSWGTSVQFASSFHEQGNKVQSHA